ncbi:hypothetical protein BN14_05184 [Rhizoctonia solani AG-1 IB]|nr:hypothetical protein BN14_05184 [Rhizoctonia solani AG-1 IB]
MSLFPNLQHLSLLDLRCNVLESLLYKIKPGSYHLTLVLTDNAVQIMTEEDPEMFVIVDRLALLLSRTRVNTLVFVRGHSTLGPWLEGSELRMLLKSASGLEELGIHGWRFDEPFCLGLIPPSNPTTESNTTVFPSLNKLYLTDLKILDVERFKHILSSVSSRSIVIWGGSRAGELSMGALHVNEEFKDWLTCNVPAARLVSSGVYPDAMKVKEWTY